MISVSELGDRICVIGSVASGKSTLADALSRKLGLKATYMDRIAYIPETRWQRRADDEIRTKHEEIVKEDSWIIEANVSSLLPRRLSRATGVIWLDFNPVLCALRFMRRSLFEGNKYDNLGGNRDHITLGILRYILFQYPDISKRYPGIMKRYKHLKVIKINSMKDLNLYYRAWGLTR